jgi:hypothetical protein
MRQRPRLRSGPDVLLYKQPANAISAALKKIKTSAADLSAIEINEAFAAVAAQSLRELGMDQEIINQHGGAIALGRPVGASGVRLIGTLARQLSLAGAGNLGAAGTCGGGGQRRLSSKGRTSIHHRQDVVFSGVHTVCLDAAPALLTLRGPFRE